MSRLTSALPLLLLLAGCERTAPTPPPPPAGAALERAARAAGMVVASPRKRPIGVFTAEAARLCLTPRADGGLRVGASVDYGAGQRCVARGVAAAGAGLSVDMGGGCTIALVERGDAVLLPASLPAACDPRCTGRAALAGLRLERVSDSLAEAIRTRGADGRLLCADAP